MHQINGLAERAVQTTIMDKTRTIMLADYTPIINKYWEEAISTAVHL
jgi:hypothetical protein